MDNLSLYRGESVYRQIGTDTTGTVAVTRWKWDWHSKNYNQGALNPNPPGCKFKRDLAEEGDDTTGCLFYE